VNFLEAILRISWGYHWLRKKWEEHGRRTMGFKWGIPNKTSKIGMFMEHVMCGYDIFL